MVVYHISTTGTKATASGPSTPGDWSNGNCYHTALFGSVFGYIATGDEIILNDEDFSFNSQRNTSALQASVTAFTLRSRSNDQTICKLAGNTSGTRSFLLISNAATNIDVIIKGINLTHNSDVSTQSGVCVQIAGTAIQSVDFQNCRIGLTVANNSTAGHSKIIGTDSLRQRTIKFTNGTKISDVTLGATAGNFCGLFNSSTVNTVQFGDPLIADDALYIDNITLTQDATSFGLIKIDSNNASGRIVATNVTINAPHDATSVRGIVHHSGTGAVHLSGSIDNVVINDGKAQGLFLRSGGVHSLKNFTARNSHIYNNNNSALGNTVSAIGFCVLGIGNNAVGEYENVIAKDCSCWFGLLTYQSAGATATHNGYFIARRCTVEGAVIYKGGSGDTFGKYASLLVEDCHGKQDAVGLYAHNVNRAAEQRNSVFEWGSATGRNNTGGNTDSGAIFARFANGGVQWNFTATLHNLLLDNKAGQFEIVRDELLSSGSGALNVTINNSYSSRANTIVNSGSTFGTLTSSNEQSGNITFDNKGAIFKGNTAETGCNPWWLNTDRRPSDVYEHAYPDANISFGAVQSKYVSNHPFML